MEVLVSDTSVLIHVERGSPQLLEACSCAPEDQFLDPVDGLSRWLNASWRQRISIESTSGWRFALPFLHKWKTAGRPPKCGITSWAICVCN